MKIGEAEKHVKNQLERMYDAGEAQSIASLAIEHITLLPKNDRLLKKEELLSANQLQQMHNMVERLVQHEPIQYIMNKTWFYGMELFVDKNVLIPRPETEELVDWIINDVKASGKDVFQRRPMEADETTQLKILDVGSGSGCIALALKKTMPKAEVWGCDVSEEALNVARRNGSALDIRIDFQGVNFLDVAQQKHLPTVDIVVSNPPYIPYNNKAQMNPNVLEYEPHTALFVPDNDALVFYKALAQFGKHRLYKNGSIYMEIHEDLAKDVAVLFEKEGYGNVEVKKDMQGKDRIVKVVNNQ
ncbi:MAG: peptide chain release factor N(5)-glutamine methyltransferase [Flavisolibacter sp.]|jgi:release factor glutamine methyltransferase